MSPGLTLANASIGVSTRRAEFLLDMEGASATATAQGVRLVVALTERAGTLGLEGGKGWVSQGKNREHENPTMVRPRVNYSGERARDGRKKRELDT